MQPSCIHQTEIPGTSQLFLDYLYHFDRVSQFYDWPFLNSEALHEAAKAVRYPEDRRAQLTAALQKQNGDSPGVRKFAEAGTVAVVTGQQVGLLSGPEFTVFKALTAVRLAQHLNETGTPAVPVFWAASEDHDLAEVDHAWVFNQDGTPTKVSVANTASNGGPVGRVELTEFPLGELRSGLGELPFAEDVIAKVSEWYRPGATLGAAFLGFLKDLLKDFGIVFLDPLQPEIREIAAPFLRETIERVPELTEALRKRNEELTRAGYHAQVVVDEEASLLFLLGANRRTAIRWRERRFVTKDRTYSAGDLAAEAQKISPNALLRPVMQDHLLPTVGYVGGPSEVAYMAQVQVLYRKLLGRMPVIFPRNTFTLLDARSAKLLDRFRLTLPDLLDHQERVKSRIANKLTPENLTDDFEALQLNIRANLQKVQDKLTRFDPTLEKAAKKSSAKIAYQLEKLSRKTANETLRRDQRASKDADYLTNMIYPHRHLQERFYSIVPFLARHGWDLPQRIFESVQLTCPHHMVRTV
ncbi:MAG TPA: bacillithiol biosynthesis cysteine-adding enzyme BshC [Bryobacteraceae bacterium]|nr:bacillithiol biosynthesis cysteine-adding enzyme BshC [Bryobacteraceae bacterium]